MSFPSLVRSFISAIMTLAITFGLQFGSKQSVAPAYPTTSAPAAIVHDGSNDSPLSDSISLANGMKNGVQCAFLESTESTYRMANQNAVLTHTMSSYQNSATLSTPDGRVYLADTFNAWCTDMKKTGIFYSSDSTKQGRVNAIRMGEYYYECHVRNYRLETGFFFVDKCFHIYADRMYLEYTVLAENPTERLKAFGSEIMIPKTEVASLQVVDKNGTHSNLLFDQNSVEYVAFDVIDVGVVGFIIPADGSTKSVSIKQQDGYYVLTQTANFEPGAGINKFDETGPYAIQNPSMGCRIYTDETHTFDGVRRAAYEERHPLTVKVNATNANAVFTGYNALRGTYDFTMDGIDFNTAYYQSPDLRLQADVTVTGDDADRNIFMRMGSNLSAGAGGALEAGAIFDETGQLVPIDVEVCKNFQGDVMENRYNPVDHPYNDMIFPLAVGAKQDVRYTAQELYQNWGKYPLKQISSIEFWRSYFHLSTGVTESNCISPYFVRDTDGWLLPDTRTGASGKMWADQPQYNSIGEFYFCDCRTDDANISHNVFMGASMHSVGPTYSDMTLQYYADDGSYTYTLRHSELPQTDENRTFYSVNITFNQDVSFENFRRDFDIFRFNGRFQSHEYLAYLDENNETRVVAPDFSPTDYYYPLGDDCPFFCFYKITPQTLREHFGSNFALLVRGGSMTVNGEAQPLKLALRDSSVDPKKSEGRLTLNKKAISFKKGDTISVDMILLPWGVGDETGIENVDRVREDSCLNPLRVTNVQTGSVAQQWVVPTVRCENNEAQFTVAGGRNNCVVKSSGFTVLGEPTVEILENGAWKTVELASVNGHDGYGVSYEPDGTYSYSFVFTTDLSEKTFRVRVDSGERSLAQRLADSLYARLRTLREMLLKMFGVFFQK